MYVTIFIVALVVAIMFHEFGHYVTAKAFGMKVDRFFLGFGPTLWSVRRGETEYGVKAIPAGGFVRIVGMSSFEDIAEADRGRSFYEQPAWQRVVVLSAGSATHFLVAVVLLYVGFVAAGVPTASNIVGLVTDDSPAAAAGIEEGDRIVAVDGTATADFDAVRDAITSLGGQTVPLTLERDGAVDEVAVALAAQAPDGSERGFLGVAPTAEARRLGPGEALGATFSGDYSFPRLVSVTVDGIVQVFSPQGLANWFGQVGGDEPRSVDGPVSPVGIAQAVNVFGQEGDLFAVLIIFAQLNLVLGLLNMAPLPPLDGGHVATLAVEESVNAVRRWNGKPGTWRLDPAVVTPIALLVIAGFTVIFLTALYLDVAKPITDLLQ